MTVLEELGADAHVFFLVDAAPAGDAQATGSQAELLAERGHALHGTGRAAHDAPASASTFALAVDPARFHFFDPETGRSLLGTPAEAAAAGASRSTGAADA